MGETPKTGLPHRNALAFLRLCGTLREAVRVASRREASTLKKINFHKEF
ncbi:MAG: hypothetical protein V7K50_16930 [Nostoc sp.]